MGDGSLGRGLRRHVGHRRRRPVGCRRGEQRPHGAGAPTAGGRAGGSRGMAAPKATRANRPATSQPRPGACTASMRPMPTPPHAAAMVVIGAHDECRAMPTSDAPARRIDTTPRVCTQARCSGHRVSEKRITPSTDERATPTLPRLRCPGPTGPDRRRRARSRRWSRCCGSARSRSGGYCRRGSATGGTSSWRRATMPSARASFLITGSCSCWVSGL